jgi:phospholipid/cholesterol/gamma-HCH transport system substrate-binding protein
MAPYKRNWIVGLVVLLGLGIVGWMILLFAGRLGILFAPPGIPITMTADRADGVSDGSELRYLGQPVGRVLKVILQPEAQTVEISAEVNKQPPLPANLQALIQAQSAFGSAAAITLQVVGSKPAGTLAAGAHLQATYATGSGLVPKEITQIAEDLHRQQLIQHLDETVVSIREQSVRAGELLGAMQQLIGDQKMRQDLQTAVTNIKTASESASRVGQNLEKFSGNLQHVSDQTSATMSEVRVAAVRLGSVLDHFDSIATKMDQGKGTAGMLINDPKLYQGLVDSTKQLNATIADLQRVVQQWEQEGVTLKLGK